MFVIITTSRGSPPARGRHDFEWVILFPRTNTMPPGDREGSAAGPPRVRKAPGDPSPTLRVFESKSEGPSGSHLGRAHRLLAADLTYIAHPSFDDPTAREAILAPAAGFESPRRDPAPAG